MGVRKQYYPGATVREDREWRSLDGYEWEESSVYNEDIDSTIKYGSSYGLPRRPFVGGSWVFYSYNGPRSIICHYYPSIKIDSCTTRGCMNNCIILGRLGMKNITFYLVMNGKNLLYIIQK